MEKTNIKAYFSAWADESSVDDFTEDFTNKLGIMPTSAFNKVVFIEGMHCRLGTSWELGTDYEESLDINKQLNLIVNQLKGKGNDLNRLKQKYDLAYRFFIVIQIENNEQPVMFLDSSFIHFANLLGAEVEFDLYIYS